MNLEKYLIPRITTKDKALFYENIANLLDGGVTLLSALNGFKERTEHVGLKRELDNLLFFVESGDSLSVGMRKQPNFFTDAEIAIIESGEQTGNLQTSFMSLAKSLADREELKGKVKNAMTYPFVIFVFLLIAIAIVMMYVIPQIVPIIAEAAGELPFSTKTLILTSEFLKDNILYIILTFVGIGLIIKGYVSTDEGRYKRDAWFLKFPVIGTVYKNYLIVRMMSTFSLLLSSGITILKTLRLTGASTGNLVVTKMFAHITDQVAHGKKIAESMHEADPMGQIFSSNILQMIESGEKTSTMNIVAEKLSGQYRREVDTSLAIMIKFIEPIALLIAGVFVLWFAIAIFSAIMGVVSSAGL